MSKGRLTSTDCWSIALIVLGGFITTSCGEAPSVIAPPEITQPAAPVVDQERPIPQPRYADEEDGVYYYVSAVSENDRADGKATGRVIGFRYEGINARGEHVLSNSGARSFCKTPCRIIRGEDGSRIAYSEDSVIGGAFADAFEGLLKQTGSRPVASSASVEKPALTVVQAQDRNSFGFGCSCYFKDLSQATILMAGGNDNLIFRTSAGRQQCSLQPTRMQEAFDGSFRVQCAGMSLTVNETGGRADDYESFSAPAQLTAQNSAGQTFYAGNWTCSC